MRNRDSARIRGGAASLALLLLPLAASAAPLPTLGTAFSYQGRLTEASAPANGSYDLRFTLFDAATAGTAVGTTLDVTGVVVTRGLFTVSLDFGSTAFTGDARWLEVAVRKVGATGPFATVLPRQELKPTPNALFAASVPWDGLSGKPSGFADNSDDDTLGALTCPAGSVPKTNGTTWSCGSDLNTGGTVTSVTAGTGLTGGTITGSGTLAVSFGGTGVTNSAARSDHNHTGTYLPAAIAACPPGATLQQINPNGSVVCHTADAQPGFSISTVDGASSVVGQYSSITIGADGLALISYFDSTLGALMVAHCSDVVCSTSTVTMLDCCGKGQYTSITIGSDNYGLISYYDSTNGDLKVAHCVTTTCQAATPFTIDLAGNVGQFTSIAIGTDGFGLISYYDVTNGELLVAHCANVACSSLTSSTPLDTGGNVGQFTSIAIGADGLGLISYSDISNGDLKVAHCSNALCTASTNTALDMPGTVGQYTSIAIGVDGLGLVSYFDSANADLRVAHCANALCNASVNTVIDSVGIVGISSSLTIGPDGRGLISYYDSGNFDLKAAHCINPGCSSATTSVIDSANAVGLYSAITIGNDGLALISYLDNTLGALKVVHCSNALCMPNVRRR